ncbi:hypothetical protein BJY04DRAFT_220645 [Aspergillus karnatakaensis]|uniref:Hsp70 family protein n=1 Tax=Aspergillus karnatakaensis TaxID=1810916 RepID=UPI003CCE0C4D
MSQDNEAAPLLPVIVSVDFGTTDTAVSVAKPSFRTQSSYTAPAVYIGVFEGLHKPMETVATDFLSKIYSELPRILGWGLWPPIRFIFTVPASWSIHGSQAATRRAAKEAGLLNRPEDTLDFVTEPYAAALYVLKAPRAPNFQPKDGVVICDAGGGTTDITIFNLSRSGESWEWNQITAVQGELANPKTSFPQSKNGTLLVSGPSSPL